MPRSGQSIDLDLSELLAWIDKGELAIPDFQRSFVWPSGATAELVASIASDYPAGTLLLLENTGQFTPRPFDDGPAATPSPRYLVLDGQQRLTALYHALYGRGKSRFFAHWKKLLDDDATFDDDAIEIRKATAKKPADEDELFPLSEVYGGAGAVRWLLSKKDVQLQTTLDSRFRRRWIESIEKYRFPVVMLRGDTPMEAVCTIFETLNRTGIKLTVFELLTAKLRPHGVNLRDNWAATLERSDIIANFQVQPEDFLRILGILVSPKNNDAAKPKALLKLTATDISTYWLKAEEGLSEALDLLATSCGAIEWRRIPYPALGIPIAAAFTIQQTRGAQKGAAKQRLRQWFWCSTFSEAYESGQSTKMVSDSRELTQWLAGGSPPKVVADFNFEPSELLEVTAPGTARYKGIISLMLARRPHDFHDDKEITPERVRAGEVDDHHVFPRKYLKTTGQLDAADCILNHALIDRATNKRIGDNAPSVYIAEIQKHWDDQAVRRLLESHLLPYEPLVKNDFKEFLTQRQQLLHDAIKQTAQGP
ncbi:MAG: hypothetical protein A2148_06675 [Chloroflexi bacterium RBG_16_68_14]|nr:MAG: hypothetical protein A2148_06675 [Chloroflexi bacterium RBG_16_68_14]